jgi:nitroimidazol reductase NimA-like FMN-containing flavoprotein (pyridoxamine 5'-phosphate oxidase superfamily)
MTDVEVAAYLEAPGRLVRIGTVAADGAPLVVPAWFVFEEGRLFVTPRERSAWLANVRHEPRVCFTVDGDGCQVVVRGVAVIEHEPGDDDAWRDRYRRITLRYLPEAAGDAYLRDTWDEPRALLSVALSAPTTTVTTWRFPMREGEDWLDVWAPRYYHEGHPRARS